jgi:hypothetical protein
MSKRKTKLDRLIAQIKQKRARDLERGRSMLSPPDRARLLDTVMDELSQSDRPINAYEHDHLSTLCEIVSEHEIYSLRENPDFDPLIPGSRPYLRDRRICGMLRSKQGLKLRCLAPAGRATNHVGYGYCRYHEQIRSQRSPLNVLAGYSAQGLALEMKELFDIAPYVLDDPRLGDVEIEIHSLNLVLKHLLNLEYVAAAEIRDTTVALARVKRARQQIMTERLLLDTQSLKLFVSSLFKLLGETLSRSQYSKVVAEFHRRVYFPINKSMQMLIQDDAPVDQRGTIVRQPKLPGSRVEDQTRA